LNKEGNQKNPCPEKCNHTKVAQAAEEKHPIFEKIFPNDRHLSPLLNDKEQGQK